MDTATAVAVYHSSNTLVYIGEVTTNGWVHTAELSLAIPPWKAQ